MEEAARICGLNRSTLTRHAIAGRLVTHLVGERRLVEERVLARFIDNGCRVSGKNAHGKFVLIWEGSGA